MRTHRRGFLRFAAGAAIAFLGRPVPAWAAPDATALEIHRATRNTRLGAIGSRLRARRAALLPRKPYPGVGRQALPAPDWVDGTGLFDVARAWNPDVAFAGASLPLEQLSTLLALTNGITQPGPRLPLRAAPSAGALYAGEVYVVAERVKGIAPGAYSYSVMEHALVPVNADARLADVAAALERPSEVEGAAAAILLTNVFARYRGRYANRGYRYALIDSGHIGENLRLAAAESGLGERAPLRWEDDQLNGLLRIDGRAEAVCDVHLIGKAGAARGTATAVPLVERQVANPEAIPGAGNAPVRYHEATKLVAIGEVEPARTPNPSASQTSAPSPSSKIGAAKQIDRLAGAPAVPVHAVIRQRRSARHFEPTSLPRDTLLHVLHLARGLPALHRTRFVELFAVVHRVAGLSPGLYRHASTSESDSGRLEPLRTGSLAAQLVDADLGQTKSGEAAVALIAVANLADASAAGGARSYRDVLLDAGATAQRIYLGAEASGVAARNLAAYYDDELDALLGLDGERRVAVHLTALGPGD